jgi:hypothetical protein
MSASTTTTAERAPHDFYPTPPWCVRAILNFLPVVGPVLDPAAGDGAILRVVRDAWGVQTIGYDIDEARIIGGSACVRRDALAPEPWAEAPLVIMNPPFSHAQAFVERAIREVAARRGTIAALLRLAFLASKRRYVLHEEHPSDVFVMPDRPSFTKDGQTDRYDYAWFVWGPDRGARWRVLT